MAYESANRAMAVQAERAVAVLGRLRQLFDGPLGHHDEPQAEIEMMRAEIITALNDLKSILDTPAGEKTFLTFLRNKLAAAQATVDRYKA